MIDNKAGSKALAQLEKAWAQKHRKLSELKTAAWEKRNELECHYKEVIANEVARLFGEQLEAASKEHDEAQGALRAEESRLAKSGVGARFPLGTRFIENRDKTPWASQTNWEPTGKVGIYEIITAESQHPGSSRESEIGTHVIRLLLKDGRPGKQYVRFQGHGGDEPPYGWFPEDPKLAQKDGD